MKENKSDAICRDVASKDMKKYQKQLKFVKKDGERLKSVPVEIIDKVIAVAAVEQNGLALQYVPSKFKSKSLCLAAIDKNILALEYVPTKFKTSELCNKCILSNWRAFLYVPDEWYSLDKCIDILNQILCFYNNSRIIGRCHFVIATNIINRIPEGINNEKQILKLIQQLITCERRFNARYCKEKLFNANINMFTTKEYICYNSCDYEREFSDFDEFYDYLDGDLKDANLFDFEFKDVNLKNFNIDGAKISSKVLVEQGLYDDSYYKANIGNIDKDIESELSFKNELVSVSEIEHKLVFSHELNDRTRKIYYISDIHINHKIKNKFPLYAMPLEVRLFIQQFIQELMVSAYDKDYMDYLVVAGDTSSSFDTSKMFYEELIKRWDPSKIIVVLGNHELWSFNHKQACDVVIQKIIDQYRKFFNEVGIVFLQNDLLMLTIDGRLIITENELHTINMSKLKELALCSSLIVLGGLGYSGLNNEFNATNGIYRDTVSCLDDDILQTKRFESIYNIVEESLQNERVVVVTHTPKENWTSENYNSNWLYVNGHTHRNEYCYNGDKTVYADNQLGYSGRSGKLKYFKIDRYYDEFKEYKDGMYVISREQFLHFNHGKGIMCQFNRTDGKVHMLKNGGVYCFLFENNKSGKISLLNGGSIVGIKNQDIEYYYKSMPFYSMSTKRMLTEYNSKLKDIARCVKVFGGTGTIHGCIIDIDSLNHIYLNPMDGTVTPYFAWSINDKYVYRDIETMLDEKCHTLYDNYKTLQYSNSDEVKLISGESSAVYIKSFQKNTETAIYGPSRIMKSFQYLTEDNIIRIWDENIMDMQDHADNNIEMPQDAESINGTLRRKLCKK